MENDSVIKERILTILPLLDERQSRVYLAAEAKSIGWGGVSKISQLSYVSRRTIAKGGQNLKSIAPDNRIRKQGGGRKKITDTQPEILLKIKSLVEPHTMGDPMNPLIWTSKSVRRISAELVASRYEVSHEVVRRCLKTLGFSLQANKKTDEGAKSEDRNAQFEYINEMAISFMEKGNPVISVDCKKKELIGNFKNNGTEWEHKKAPIEVKVYDFVDKELGKAVPYGIYDLAQNNGFVNVGISADTAEFAVHSIRTWWQEMGKELYPNSKELYINADGGGSNSTRGRLWKRELQKLSTETRLKISVSHFPPGTSKWNKIEHRLFSYISKNWRAKPLTSIEVIVNLIANTTTETGLKVRSKKDEKIYHKGLKISDEEFSKINMERTNFRGDWNYVISPQIESFIY
jgi:transposase